VDKRGKRHIVKSQGLTPYSSDTKATEVILKELKDNNYAGIIIGKHPMTRAQEFLFGSTTVTLVREAPVNIISVKMPAEAAE